MEQNKISAFNSFIKEHACNLPELYQYLNTITPGDFHFTNGSHFPELIPGYKADGVYISDDFYITDIERDGATTKNRAGRFCRNRGTVLPDFMARNNMKEYRDKINASLRRLNFPCLKSGEYWAENDTAGEGSAPTTVTSGPGIGDDTLIVDFGTMYKKNVRGCIKVKRQTPMTLDTASDPTEKPAEDFPIIAQALQVNLFHFFSYLKDRSHYPLPGNYLLKNGQRSDHTVYDQEAGIYVNAETFINLNMPQQLLTAEEAMVYCKAYGQMPPSYFELRQMKEHREKINLSLAKVGMKDFAVPQNTLEECWCKESLMQASEHKKTKPKRLFLAGQKPNIPHNYIILQDIMEHFRYPDD